MPRYRYYFDVGELFARMVAAGLPVESIEGLPRIVIVTSRRLTDAEKTALSNWVLGAWSAYNVATGAHIHFVVEEEIPE